MSSRTIQRTVISSILAFGVVAAGCGDDDSGDDSGTTGDAGAEGGATAGDGGGDEDAGEEDAGGDDECPSITDVDLTEDCITVDGEECCPFVLVTGPVRPCAFPKSDGSMVCGVNADDIKCVNPGSAFEGCIEADAPGVASDAAGVFFDRTGSDDKAELTIAGSASSPTCDVDFSSDTGEMTGDYTGKFNLYSSTLGGLSYDGCCTPSGQFGVNLSASLEYPDVNAHLGCKGFLELQSSLASGGDNEEPCVDEKDEVDAREADPTMARNAGVLPYCDPTTGDAGSPPVMTALCAQLPALSPQAFPVVCTGAEPTPDWIKATIFMEAVAPTFPDDCVQLLSDAATSCPVDGDGVPTPDGTCIPVAGANELPGCVAAP